MKNNNKDTLYAKFALVCRTYCKSIMAINGLERSRFNLGYKEACADFIGALDLEIRNGLRVVDMALPDVPKLLMSTKKEQSLTLAEMDHLKMVFKKKSQWFHAIEFGFEVANGRTTKQRSRIQNDVEDEISESERAQYAWMKEYTTAYQENTIRAKENYTNAYANVVSMLNLYYSSKETATCSEFETLSMKANYEVTPTVLREFNAIPSELRKKIIIRLILQSNQNTTIDAFAKSLMRLSTKAFTPQYFLDAAIDASNMEQMEEIVKFYGIAAFTFPLSGTMVEGKEEFFHKLTEFGANINECEGLMLRKVCLYNNHEKAFQLFRRLVEVDKLEPSLDSVMLTNCVESGNALILEYLLNYNLVDIYSGDHITLRSANFYKKYDLCKLILENGYDKNGLIDFIRFVGLKRDGSVFSNLVYSYLDK